MADNTTLNTMSGGDTIATDDIAALSAKVQRIKLGFGTDGSWTEVSSSNGLPVDSELAAAVAAADNMSNPTTAPVIAHLAAYNATTHERLRVVAGDAQAGTGMLAIVPMLYNGSTYDRLRGNTAGLYTQGTIAHDAVDSGNPHKMGGKAVAHGSNPTAVAAADRTDWYFNRHGIPFVIGGHPNIVTIEAAYTAAQTDTAIVTIATGLKIVVTSLLTRADNANTVDVGFRVGFGTANTPTTTGVVDSHPGVAAGSGTGVGDGSGIVGIGADNEDLRITSEAPTTGSFRVVAKYYTIES